MMAVLSTLEKLTPIVRWAQSPSKVDLTVELIDVKNPNIVLTENSLEFTGFGSGAKGENYYNFTLEFYGKIDKNVSSFKVTDRNVTFKIMKDKEYVEWPRLLKSEQKPGWLKIDFDKLEVEDSEPEEKDEMAETINKISFEQRMKNDVDKAKDDIVAYSKVAWLTIYNLLQAVCFSMIFVKIIIIFMKHGRQSSLYVYDEVSDLLLSCQLAAFVEILNPLFGIVKTGLVAPSMQVLGRNFVLFVLIVPVKYFHQSDVVTVLFLAWSAIEVVRYPFYLMTLHRYQNIIIAWLRYSAWVPLYPLGMACEVLIMILSIRLPETESRFSYPMPNMLNISINLSSLLKLLLCTYFPLSLYLLKHMWILRQRKLGGGRKKVKQS